MNGDRDPITARWEDGVPHHPVAVAIYRLLERSDWILGHDHFQWKAGGDGDNGEHLMFCLSEHIDRDPSVLDQLRRLLEVP